MERWPWFDNVALKEDLLRGVYDYWGERPYRIEQVVVPMVEGKDLIHTQTQSGTATFTIGVLNKLDYTQAFMQALILTPTRELAQQTQQIVTTLGVYLGVKCHACTGGTRTRDDIQIVQEGGVQVIVGTPGIVLDLIKSSALSLDAIKVLVLDETDDMLSRGFKEPIYNVFQAIPHKPQVCLFTAALEDDTLEITRRFMNDPVHVVSKKSEVSLGGVRQYFINVDKEEWKLETLFDLMDAINFTQLVIFCNTRNRVTRLAERLEDRQYMVGSIHGMTDRREIDGILKDFRSGRSRILVTTNHQLDLPFVSPVINYDLPKQNFDDYVYRVGWFGRIFRRRIAVSLVTNDEIHILKEIERYCSVLIEDLPILVVVCLLYVTTASCWLEDQVQTEGGIVRGSIFDNYRSFKGIPFVAPPVGELRWAAPQPHAPWSPAVWDATKYSAGCPQICALPKLICPDRTDEDCLYLNVFTPRLSQMDSKVPVMVFFPGGHYDQGTATTDFYNGGYMVNRSSVILVTVNYRLGALGWVATGTLKGNYGFQDQLASLQWVQRNIANFGGDHTQVTIFGESAGATSVAAHLISSKSTGLFSKAIIESFPATLPMKTWEDARKIGRLFLGNLTCNDGDMGCLRSKSVYEIVAAQEKVAKHLPILHPLQLFLPWTPVINGIELTNDMWTAVSSGSFNKVPLMIGTVSEEALMFIYLAARDTRINDAEYIAAVTYLFTSDFAKVLLQYPPKPIIGDKRPALGVLGTDYIFTCANRYWTGLITANNVNTWLYQFTHVSSVDIWSPNYPFCVGHVCHGVELPFLFNTLPLFNMYPTAQEVQMSNSMIDYWTNFAKSGNPNKPSPVPLWPQFDYTNLNSLNINTPVSVVQGLMKNKCDFWDSIGYFDGAK